MPEKQLEKVGFLKPKHKLRFYILKSDITGEYKVFWKIRNCGEEAYRRNDIRGQIVKDDGKEIHNEVSTFMGKHYVECYLVQNNVCVARDKIDVPINN